MALTDLSHTVEDGLVTYRGLPAPIICDYLSREAADGADLSELSLSVLAEIPATLVRVGKAVPIIDESWFDERDIAGRAVLIQTDWSRHWNTEAYYEGHPYLTAPAAIVLRDQGARLVGIDSYNIDDVEDGTRPVHTALLGAGIPIVEHLCNLDRLPPDGFKFSAVPVKVKGFGTFPVRAYAAVPELRARHARRSMAYPRYALRVATTRPARH